MKYRDIKPAGRWQNDFVGYKTIGKLRLGRQITKTERFPKEADFFRIDIPNVKIRKEFIEQFGEPCGNCAGKGCGWCGSLGYVAKRVLVCLPSEDRTDFAPRNFEHWRGGAKMPGSKRTGWMRCTGDAEECTRWLVVCTKCGHEFIGENWAFEWAEKGFWKHKDAKLASPCPECSHKGKGRIRRILPCPGIECEAFKKKLCKRIMRLHVYAPTVYAGGVLVVETGSGNVMFYTLEEDLKSIRDACGRVSMLLDEEDKPVVVLHRVPKKTYQEHPSTHHLVRLSVRSDINVQSLRKLHQHFFELEGGKKSPIALPGPPPEPEIPEEQFPREIVHEAKKVVEVPLDYDEGHYDYENGEPLMPETPERSETPEAPAVAAEPKTPETPEMPEGVLARYFGSLPSVLTAFADENITTIDAIPKTVEGLIKLKGIGPKKAKKVLEILKGEGAQQAAQPVEPEPQPEPKKPKPKARPKAKAKASPVLEQIEEILRAKSGYSDQMIDSMLQAASVSDDAAQKVLASLQERYSDSEAPPAREQSKPEPKPEEPKGELFGEDLGTTDLGI